MRKLLMLAALVATLTMMFSAAALAVNAQCSYSKCSGTSGKDTLYERGGNRASDNISGKEGRDRIDAQSFTPDTDKLYGGEGNDRLFSDDGDGSDLLNGGRGHDRCTGDVDDTYRSCEEKPAPIV